MDISSLIPVAEDGPNRFLLESIGNASSQVLETQQRAFNTALGGEGESEVVCFYETLRSPTAVQVCLFSETLIPCSLPSSQFSESIPVPDCWKPSFSYLAQIPRTCQLDGCAAFQ